MKTSRKERHCGGAGLDILNSLPGVARSALTPGYFMSRLQREEEMRIAYARDYFFSARFAISSKYFANATIPPDACCQSKFSLGAW